MSIEYFSGHTKNNDVYSDSEVTQLRQLLANNPEYNRAELSRQVCRMIGWHKADGGLKEMSCRVAMLRMHADGLIRLPPPARTKPALRPISFTPATDPLYPIVQPVHNLGPIRLCAVERADSGLWNEYIQRGLHSAARCSDKVLCFARPTVINYQLIHWLYIETIELFLKISSSYV